MRPMLGTLRGLDRAHAAVVGEVDVTDFEARTLAGQTPGAERREATAVGQARQRVDLVHELRQLRGAEELLDRRHHRADVDQGLRGDGLDVLGGHALTHDSLHPAEADADLVLDQLADAADTAVCEVVLVVEAVARFELHQVQQVCARGEHLGRRQHGLVGLGALELETEELLELVDLGAELAVQLVAADTGEVVAAALEERVAEVVAGRLDRRRLTRAGTLVDLEQRLFLGERDFLLQLLFVLGLEEAEVLHERRQEAGVVLLVEAQRTNEREEAEAALAGDTGTRGRVLAGLLLDVELDPLPAVGVDGAGDQLVLGEVTQAVALARLEDDARRPDQLRHHDTLGAVDHERALVGHHREVPHEDRLFLDLAGVGVHEPSAHEDRRRVGHVLLFALLHRELGRRAQILVIGIELELQLECLGEVLDGTDVAEGVRQTFVQEPLERFALDGDQIRKLEDIFEIGE